MNDLEVMLAAIGDLEFTRRRLMQRVAELEAELEALKNSDAERPESD